MWFRHLQFSKPDPDKSKTSAKKVEDELLDGWLHDLYSQEWFLDPYNSMRLRVLTEWLDEKKKIEFDVDGNPLDVNIFDDEKHCVDVLVKFLPFPKY